MRDHTYLHVHSRGGTCHSQRHFSDWLAAHMWEELPVKQWTEWNFPGRRRLSLSICPDWFHSEYQSHVGHRRHKTVIRAKLSVCSQTNRWCLFHRAAFCQFTVILFLRGKQRASRTALRQRVACSVQRYIHWKGFPSLCPPYPSWSALKNNTPAVHTRRFVSATAALEIANFPHHRLAAILHICPSLLNLFSPWRRLKCSRTIGEGAANDKVHYGSMMAFNMGDVLLFPSHWANLRKCTEGKKKEVFMSNSLVTGFVIYQKTSDRRPLHYVIMNRNW